MLIHEKSSLAPPGQSLAFSLGDEKGFEWIGAYDITADELLAGTDTAKTESKTAQAEMLILELLANGKKMPSAELEKAVNDRGHFLTHHANGEKPYRRQAHNRERRHSMGLLSPKLTQEQGKRGKDGKVFIDTLMLPPCLVPSY